ncbi:FAD-dependent monooxygenase [Microbacterium sp. 10M-3C3]|jgi:2-polyprenyl-6-methoxyphenol hydroxylase-like FAD-dependent oxidoreductase|uniref:FAD-dependent oxidoreductase n=1 Tax=Microbacterium sp. 10M-3C3 TaxID=2483401 RepID=UPI000F62D695|nr:FAD-dependent monooxygenase [Microbacterium sp. 10M-3C3]
MPDVAIVGAGPVGTLLAAELARRGVDVVAIERRADAAVGSRAIGVHAPVLAALEPSGATERLLAAAVRVGVGEARSRGRLLGAVRFDRLSARFPFVATLPQTETFAALATDAPVPLRGEAVAVRGGARPSVRVRGADGGEHVVEARIVVVAAGPRARALLWRPGAARERACPDRYVMADVPADGGDVAVVNLDRGGVLESFPLPGGVRRFVAAVRADVDAPDARTAALRAALGARGLDEEAARIERAEEFRIRRALAPALRRGPLFAIGDTAHEVSPIGGQGMNLGLLDAATLAPLLATWVRTGAAPDAELARWERRRLASSRVSGGIAVANTVLGRPAGPRVDAARAAALRVALATPAARLLAHAYAMGFDRG